MHINIRSLWKHWDELNIHLASRYSYLDIIVITDINKDEVLVNNYIVPGFSAFSLYRQGGRGGGILVFIWNYWMIEQNQIQFAEAEVLVITMTNRKESFVVAAIYRPPSSGINIFLEELNNFLKRNGVVSLVLTGDMNIDVMNYSKPEVRDYLDLLAAYGLENQIKNCTREKYLGTKMTRSCLDHIITRVSNAIITSAVIKQKLSDHYFTVVAFLGKSNQVSGPLCNTASSG